MGAVTIGLRVLWVLLLVFLLLLWARVIVDLVRAINRSWRPRGALLVVVETVLTVTDPPVRLSRRLVPMLRVGPVAIDLGPTLLLLGTLVLLTVVGAFAAIG